jgi:integrase
MAINDRWYKTERQPGGSSKKVRSPEFNCDARWQVRWRDQAGAQRKKAFARKPDAEAFDAKVRTQLGDGSYIDPSAGQVTLREFAEEWRVNRLHDPNTETRVEQNLRNHVYSADGRGGRTPMGGVSLGDYPLKVLAQRPSLIQSWIKAIPLASNTQLLVIGYVSQVFRAAVADRLIAANPLKADLDLVQRPAAVKTPVIPWTASQVAAVAGQLPARLGPALYLGAACGLRQGEMFAVDASDIVFLRRTLHVAAQIKTVGTHTYFAPLKNHASCPTRDVPIADPVIPLLAEHLRAHPPLPVTLPWGKPDGKPVTRNLVFHSGGAHLVRSGFNYVWRRSWSSAGIPDRGRMNGFHVARHTAASAWLSAGLNPAKVAAYLGDTLEVVIAIYSHFMPEDDGRAREIMSRFFLPEEVEDDGSAEESAAE